MEIVGDYSTKPHMHSMKCTVCKRLLQLRICKDGSDARADHLELDKTHDAWHDEEREDQIIEW